MGAIFADYLTGQQACRELMLAIGVHGGHVRAIRDVVEVGRYAD
jgi:hypothetical protein